MKIAINGQIIDTKLIYRIGNVSDTTDYMEDESFAYYFMIYFFNSTTPLEVYSKVPNLSKDKLEEFRQQVISEWKEYQSDIPQFNI